MLSGSNNDISRLPEIRLRCRLYENKEAYYIISSPAQGTLNLIYSKYPEFSRPNNKSRSLVDYFNEQC